MARGGFAFDSSRGESVTDRAIKNTAAASATALVVTTNTRRISDDWSTPRLAKASGLLPPYRKWRHSDPEPGYMCKGTH